MHAEQNGVAMNTVNRKGLDVSVYGVEEQHCGLHMIVVILRCARELVEYCDPL